MASVNSISRQPLPSVPSDVESTPSIQPPRAKAGSQRMSAVSRTASAAVSASSSGGPGGAGGAGGAAVDASRRPSTANSISGGVRLNRGSASELACQVLVTEYEGDKRDLERELERFGTIVRMDVKRKPVLRARPDVSDFIGKSGGKARGQNRVNFFGERVVTLSDALDTDPATRIKALTSCQGATLAKLSKEHIKSLADNSIVAKPKEGQELFVEGDDIQYLYVLARGIYKMFQKVDGKEFLLGTISGAGQIVGERDFLASKAHSTTLVAETEGTAIAIPAHAVEDLLTKKEDVQNYLQDLYKSREIILSVLCKKGCALTRLLHSDESNYLTDVVGTVSYGKDRDNHGTFMTELFGCVSAVVVHGEIHMEICEDSNNEEKETKLQENETKVQVEEEEAACTEPKKKVLTSGMAIEDVVQLKYITDRSVVKVSVVEPTELILVCLEDIEPLLATNFALRTYMEALGPLDKSKDIYRRREQSTTRFPWWKCQERRLDNLFRARRRGQECWRYQKHDPEEMSEAPFFWNRTSIKSFSEEWVSLLSDAEVCVTFSSAVEAVGAVRELDTIWSNRFPCAKLAGHSHGYQLLRQRFVERIRACDYNWIAAEQVESEMESQGVSEDATIWHEFGKIYNSSYPIQIEKAYKVSERLVDCMSIDREYLLDTMEIWTSYGYSAWASRLLDRCTMRDLQIPDAAWSYLVTGWIREKDTEMALQSIKKMWSRNILPEVSLVNKLIALFVDLDQMEEAVQVLTELESAGADEGPEPTKHTYLLVLSGLATLGDGDRVKEMVSRMLSRLQEHNSTMLMNFVVESWCISGRMKKAKKFVSMFQKVSMCEVKLYGVDEQGRKTVQKCRCCPAADEHTYSILAAGWASVGNAEVAADAFLSMAEMDLDSSKIDMNQIAQYWKSGKRRQVKGYEIPVPEIKKCRAAPDGLPVPLPPPERQIRGGDMSPYTGSRSVSANQRQGSREGKTQESLKKSPSKH